MIPIQEDGDHSCRHARTAFATSMRLSTEVPGMCFPEISAWAEESFGTCALGDERRTKRLVAVAAKVATNPSASFPDQMEIWGDLKAAYRLFSAEQVTFSAVAAPHWKRTRAQAKGRTLMICDTTEVDFGCRRKIKGARPTGNGSGQGFLLHNGLMVDEATKSILGLAGQAVHYRPEKPKKKETCSERLARKRESDVWGQVIDDVGAPGEGVEYVYVCDRGADNFEVYVHLQQQNSQWVIRASNLRRLLTTMDNQSLPLLEILDHMKPRGTYDLHLRARPNQSARVAKIEVSSCSVLMPLPKHRSPWLRSQSPSPIAMNVVRIREVDAPESAEAIEWILYTSLPVETFANVWKVIEYYESRWLVEEYHKAFKTGTSIKKRQLKDMQRLEPVAAMMSVVAVRLLQLKTLANTEPARPARTVVPPLWLQMLKAVRKKLSRVHDLTIHEFYRELAKLGGFLGRKSDGEPGWITIWRGWEKLNTLVQGAELANQFRGRKCG